MNPSPTVSHRPDRAQIGVEQLENREVFSVGGLGVSVLAPVAAPDSLTVPVAAVADAPSALDAITAPVLTQGVGSAPTASTGGTDQLINTAPAQDLLGAVSTSVLSSPVQLDVGLPVAPLGGALTVQAALGAVGVQVGLGITGLPVGDLGLTSVVLAPSAPADGGASTPNAGLTLGVTVLGVTVGTGQTTPASSGDTGTTTVGVNTPVAQIGVTAGDTGTGNGVNPPPGGSGGSGAGTEAGPPVAVTPATNPSAAGPGTGQTADGRGGTNVVAPADTSLAGVNSLNAPVSPALLSANTTNDAGRRTDLADLDQPYLVQDQVPLFDPPAASATVAGEGEAAPLLPDLELDALNQFFRLGGSLLPGGATALTPEQAGLADEAAPFGLEGLGAALDQFVDQAQASVGTLTDLLARLGPTPWLLMGLSLSLAAVELNRVRRRRLDRPFLTNWTV